VRLLNDDDAEKQKESESDTSVDDFIFHVCILPFKLFILHLHVLDFIMLTNLLTTPN
jgi:hypothetical protein